MKKDNKYFGIYIYIYIYIYICSQKEFFTNQKQHEKNITFGCRSVCSHSFMG